jgi:hypothetical protein
MFTRHFAADGAPIGRRAAGWAGIRDGVAFVFLDLDVEVAACRSLFQVRVVGVSLAEREPLDDSE